MIQHAISWIYVLRRNNLHKKSGTELAQALASIPQGIATLDLSENDWQKTPDELTLIFKAIPQNVATVSLSVNELNQMSPEQIKAIQTHYSCTEQIILVDTEDNNRNLV
ncbi:conserved hypothetical protein [Legionella longbeachae D-4968]|nr:conserved hypothetical protein [Legionella longbeachae D-4968]